MCFGVLLMCVMVCSKRSRTWEHIGMSPLAGHKPRKKIETLNSNPEMGEKIEYYNQFQMEKLNLCTEIVWNFANGICRIIHLQGNADSCIFCVYMILQIRSLFDLGYNVKNKLNGYDSESEARHVGIICLEGMLALASVICPGVCGIYPLPCAHLYPKSSFCASVKIA